MYCIPSLYLFSEKQTLVIDIEHKRVLVFFFKCCCYKIGGLSKNKRATQQKSVKCTEYMFYSWVVPEPRLLYAFY